MPQAAYDRDAPPAFAPGTTHVVRQRFTVPYEYPVMFTWDALAPSHRGLVDVITSREPHRRHRVLVAVDQGLDVAWPELEVQLATYFAAYPSELDLVEAVRVPAGEASKNDPALVPRLHALMARHKLDRHAFVLVIGGGAVLDAVGYAAATAHRGIRTIRMPTTVLAQNDSGVGVKNAINALGAKNFLGTFLPPFAVINDFRFLDRLPARERIAGLAEAVKVALIRDASFFGWLEANVAPLREAQPEAIAYMIRRCAELHLAHIAGGGDPFEQGSARPLDFGHWSAHKLEALTRHELRHGEAVALGLLLDSRYAVLRGLLPEPDFDRIFRLIGRLGLPLWHQALRATDPDGGLAVLAGLDDFREHLGGDLTVTLLLGIGRAVDVNEMDPVLITEAIAWLEARRPSR